MAILMPAFVKKKMYTKLLKYNISIAFLRSTLCSIVLRPNKLDFCVAIVLDFQALKRVPGTGVAVATYCNSLINYYAIV